MTWDDVSPGRAPHPGGGSGRDRDLEELLDGGRRPGTEDEMSMDRLLSALRAPGTADELRGLEAATAAFVSARAEAAAPVLQAVGGRARRPLTAASAAVVAVVASVAFAGTAAAAYTGSLPRPVQEVAHTLFGAPAPRSDETAAPAALGQDATSSERTSDSGDPSSSGSGPAVTAGAPDLAGLCQAFANRSSSDPATGSTAYQALSTAAQSAGQSVQQYCSTLVTPAASHRPSGAGKPSGRPSAPGTPNAHASVRATPSAAASHRPAPSGSTTRGAATRDSVPAGSSGDGPSAQPGH